MKLKANSVTFTIRKLLKQSKPGNTGLTLNLKGYPPDRRLCICKLLKHCLFCTKTLRKNSKQLFISYRKPHEPVGKQTISRWICDVLHKAGVDTSLYKAHSTRAAASSAALDKNVAVSDILATAGWASEKPFTKYYS